MGFLNIDAIMNSGKVLQNPRADETTESSRLNSVMTGSIKVDSPAEDDNALQYMKNGNYDDFQKSASKSKLNSNFMNENDLLKKGFVKSGMLDMNGGVYYTNKKTGETVRIQNHRIFGDGKSMSYRNDNMSHFVTYDDNGKETGGVLQIKQPDGTIKVYNYDVDIEGNKFIKSVETSEYNYFAEYE